MADEGRPEAGLTDRLSIIPEKYKFPNALPVDLQSQSFREPLTGLPVLTDGVWNVLASRIRESYNQNEGFALLVGDGNQLKAINDMYGNPAGDDAIIRSMAHTAYTVEELNLQAKRALITRKRTAGDEVSGMWLGLSIEDQRKLVAAQAKFEEQFRLAKAPENFSLSVGIITSEDIQRHPELEKKLRNCRTDEDFLATLEEYISGIAHEKKVKRIAQDIARESKETTNGGVAAANAVLSETLGYRRIGEAGMDKALYIPVGVVLRGIAKRYPDQTLEQVLADQNITLDDLVNMSDPEDIRDLVSKLGI